MKTTDYYLNILSSIKKTTDPLNPPVESFEKSIRSTPLRILISILISSRTKDKVTMGASERLFSIADTPEKILNLGEKKVSELIYPVGFFRQKARNIIKIAGYLHHSGNKISSDFNKLIELPGVGRKTANLIRSLAFGIPSISVDIHVFRISKRLGWASGDKPEIVEKELKDILPKNLWNRVNRVLVGFGQTICKPVNPSCNLCKITDECDFFKSGKNPTKIND